ncbi:MAG: thioredoxin domain-containing protein [Holosporaceae bacterium]|nr:MAG: thioredoxin domain-containing protein [Holosporaceae bacterium]
MRIYYFILIALGVIFSHAHGTTSTYHTSVVFGSPKAPVTITELVAPTCHVCSDFSQTLVPKITQHYVRKGKVRLIIIPLTYNYVDLKASQLILGMPNPKQMYANVFKSQDKWLLKKIHSLHLNQYL